MLHENREGLKRISSLRSSWKTVHSQIIQEEDRTAREHLYSQLYDQLHDLHERAGWHNTAADVKMKTRLVRLFRNELEGKSVLDVGCGRGTFLQCMHASLEHKRLLGIDLTAEILPHSDGDIQFIRGNVIDFAVEDPFDVVFSGNMIEHIAPADLPTHLQSIKSALRPGGTLIVLTPNRLFGPHDITMLIDASHTNRVKALAGHLNETTYTELVPTLQEHGFSSFRTTLPTPFAWYYLPGMRLSPKFMQAIESRAFLLNLMYRLRVLAILLSRLLVVVICKR